MNSEFSSGGKGPEWEDPRRVLKRHGLAPRKAFSQNFLVSREILASIGEALAIRPEERIVELGAGLGTLTGELLRRGARVLAVERERATAEALRAELGTFEALTIVEGDAASFDLGAVAEEEGGPIGLAGNLPYAITGSICRNLVAHRRALDRAVLMVQLEVAERLAAEPGGKTYGALTVFVSAAFEVEMVCRVPRGAFHPPPKVKSAVVLLRSLPEPRAEETPAFRAVVKTAFGQRRKTLRKALRSLLGRAPGGGEAVDEALRSAGVEGGRRGETCSVEELAAIAAALAPALAPAPGSIEG